MVMISTYSQHLRELIFRHDCSKPETVAIGEFVACSTSVTFNERSGSEVFQTGAGRLQVLSTALSSSTSMLVQNKQWVSLNVNYFSEAGFESKALDNRANMINDSLFSMLCIIFTITKLYPIHRLPQPSGQSGM